MRDDKSKTKIISSKKAAKRRARNKVRKKRKQEQKRQWVSTLLKDGSENQETLETTTATVSAANASPTIAVKTKTNEKRRKTHHENNEVNLVERANQIWQQTYGNAVRWICAHQVNYWKQRALQLQKENEKLKSELNQFKIGANEEYMTSSSSEEESYFPSDRDEDQDQGENISVKEVDEGYLKFMQITQQHWKDLRHQREKEKNRKAQCKN